MRIARRTALVVALGLVMAMGFVVNVQSQGGRADAGAVGEAAIVAQPDGLQTAAARLERDQRRESLSSQRSAKHPLILLAVFGAVLAVSGLSAHRVGASQQLSVRQTRWWFRSGGRAPPLFQLSVV